MVVTGLVQSSVHKRIGAESASPPEREREMHAAAMVKRAGMKLIIVDEACRVLLDSIGSVEHELRLLMSDDRKALRHNVLDVVQGLIDQCVRANQRESDVGFLDSQRFVRVTRLDGFDVTAFAVTFEFVRGVDSLARAARKYQLTPRELDVLALILEGASAAETAETLSIAETTVQSYYKRLLKKTESRNRPAMVANVLDWAGSRCDRRRAAI